MITCMIMTTTMITTIIMIMTITITMTTIMIMITTTSMAMITSMSTALPRSSGNRCEVAAGGGFPRQPPRAHVRSRLRCGQSHVQRRICHLGWVEPHSAR
jgi:hypothetical protein